MASKVLSRSVLTLLAATALSTQAFAANPATGPEISFHPTKPWQVGQAPGGACAIKNEFNNGFVVQFDGVNEAPKAMSIDFRQGIFKPGKTYDAKIAIPGGATKNFPAKAVSAQALAMNFDGSQELFGSMRESSVFDLAVEGNDFRFYLVGFNAATKSFEKCMAAGSAPQAAEPVEKSAPAAPAPVVVPAPRKEPQAPAKQATVAKPRSDLTVNESIALEEKEARVLDGEAPAAIIDTTQSGQPILEPTPFTEKTFLGGKKVSGSRLSEKLAAEMNDPSIVGEKSPAPKGPVKKEASVPAPAPENGSFLTPPPGTPVAAAPVSKEPLEDSMGALPLPKKEPQKQVSVSPKLSPEEEGVFTPADGAQAAAIEPAAASAPFEKVASVSETKEIINFKQARVEPKPITPPPAQAKAKPEAGSTAVIRTSNLAPKESHSTPEMVVRKSSQHVELDMTDMGDDVSQIEPAAGGEEPFSTPRRKADPEMLQKISDLESNLASLRKENQTLNSELKGTLSETRNENVSISTDNWNLERATLAYNEAERQLKRLGQQLQQERAQCEMQKQDIEGQLFDPQVTSQQQLAKLADLEDQLADAQRKLDDQRTRYEERIKALENVKAAH